MSTAETRVLFVCLGNICRSPTAQGVFAQFVDHSDLSHRIAVDSCGTADWHTGKAPDERAIAAAAERNYDLSALRARQITSEDFNRFDYILAMDESNLRALVERCPADYHGHLSLLLDFYPGAGMSEVPDPYYGAADGFARVLDLIEGASAGLLRAISGQGRADAHPPQ